MYRDKTMVTRMSNAVVFQDRCGILINKKRTYSAYVEKEIEDKSTHDRCEGNQCLLNLLAYLRMNTQYDV